MKGRRVARAWAAVSRTGATTWGVVIALERIWSERRRTNLVGDVVAESVESEDAEKLRGEVVAPLCVSSCVFVVR